MREGFCLRIVDADAQKLDAREGLSREAILDACGRSADTPPSSSIVSPEEGDDTPDETRVSAFLETVRERLLALGVDESRPLSADRDPLAPGLGGRPREEPPPEPQRPGGPQLPSGRGPGASLGRMRGAGFRAAGRLAACRASGPGARNQARQWAEARDAPEGELPIVLAAGTGGVFFHEACGHSLEADLVLRGDSPFRALLGERVAAPFVSAMDDATQPGLEGSYDFDDEGCPARGNVLIARGVLKAFLADRITGARLGRGSTGSGRRESYRDTPLPRMSNAFLMAGEDDPEAILRETPRGILVSRLEGGRMDPATGDFRFRASAGRLIEAGKPTAPLRPFTLAGNGLAALRAVARVGSDLSFGDGTGSCGKDGQQLPVAAGLPTILLASLAVRPG